MIATERGNAAAELRDLIAADPARVAALRTTKAQWEVFACLRGLDELALAARVLDVLAEAHGLLAKVLDAQAQLWPLLGRNEEAVAAARERAERFPSQSGDLALVRAYLATEELDEATALAERLLARDERNTVILGLLARIALEGGDGEAALEWYERIREANPDGGEAVLGPARARVALGEEDEAAQVLADFVRRITPETPPAHLTAWAELADDLGDDATARRLRERARAIWAERAAALLPELGATPLGREQDPDAAPLDEVGDPDLPVADDRASVAVPPEALAAARDYFGHDRLRPGQSRVIAQVLAGVDTLATMPTGAGKSLCYQLPAMLLPGVTLVISPLIALMQDQVESLPPAVAARTTIVNSAIGAAENRRRIEGIARGEFGLVYAAPERLRQAPFLRALATAGVSLLVIDEAHCISLWGHDFRPDYLIVPTILPALGEPPVLALTATATPEISEEIAHRLGRDLARVRVSLFRQNLFYEVRRLANKEEKLRAVVEICRELDGTGIVYVSSRDGCEEIATLINRELKARRYDPDIALAYHAGFGTEDRAARMRRFMDGEVRIIVATIAFGMGVDKADVRFIVHVQPSRSLEAYAQESGRAGRDGEPARCILLYANSDKTTLQRRAKADEFDIETLRRTYTQLRRLLGTGWGVVAAEALEVGNDPDGGQDMRVALGILERAGLIERHPDAPRAIEVTVRRAELPGDERWGRFLDAARLGPGDRAQIDAVATARALDLSPAELEGQLLGWAEEEGALAAYPGRRELCLRLVLPPPPDAAAALPRLLDDLRRENEARVARMIAYATGRKCRHATLAAHLGERLAPCGTVCDVCVSGGAVERSSGRRDERARERVSSPGANPQSAIRNPQSDAEAALIMLNCLRTMPFPVGKTGLIRILAGSIQASVKEDRQPLFGALGGWTQGRIDALIERLIADGFLERGETEYRLLALTPQGQMADEAALAVYAAPARAASAPASAAKLTTGSALPLGEALGEAAAEMTLDAAGERRLERLKSWRSAQARERAIPPYIIAHDRQLREVALRQPANAEELLKIKGFGAAKVDTYGEEILALVADEVAG